MQYWLAEHADAIFYGLLIAMTLAEVLLRWVFKAKPGNPWLEYADSGFVAVVLALIIRTFIVQTFFIPSASMENTLLIQDKLIVNKFIYGTHVPGTGATLFPWRKPKRGDIIVFRFPGDPRQKFIKRCLGVPGDVIEMKDKVLYVNGQPQQEGYVTWRDARVFAGAPSRDNFGPLIVPEGKYFMLGDNRDESADSRFWGFLPRRFIEGQAWVIYWPLARWRVIR